MLLNYWCVLYCKEIGGVFRLVGFFWGVFLGFLFCQNNVWMQTEGLWVTHRIPAVRMSQHFQAGVGPVWSGSGGIFFQLFARLYCRCWLTAACLPRLRGWKSSAAVWVQLGRGVALSSLVVPLLQALGGEEPVCLHVLKFLVKDAAGTSRGRADRSIQSLVCNHSILGEDLGLYPHLSTAVSAPQPA